MPNENRPKDWQGKPTRQHQDTARSDLGATHQVPSQLNFSHRPLTQPILSRSEVDLVRSEVDMVRSEVDLVIFKVYLVRSEVDLVRSRQNQDLVRSGHLI